MAALCALLGALFLSPAAAVRPAVKAPKPGLLARKAPDDDHFVHEAIDNADHEVHPKDPLEKDFIALDRDHNGKLDVQELMFRQYATGCEASVAQARGLDYVQCGDKDKDGKISLQEFKDSVQAPWAECVKNTKDRRAHGFVRFFEADTDWDGKLNEHELRVGIIKMWGPAGEHLAKPLLWCVDENKNMMMDQNEFHDSIAAYNPASRSWQMWKGTSDPAIINCLAPAFKKFDAALVFDVTDTNKNQQLSKQECYATMDAVNGPGISQVKAEAIFTAADTDKNGYLSLDEFTKAGEAYQGVGESFALQGRNNTRADLSAMAKVGMGAQCHAQNGDEYRIYADTKFLRVPSNSTKEL